MSKITKGCMAMIVGADYNNGVTVTVNNFLGYVPYGSSDIADYWVVTPSRPVRSVYGELITDGICREAYLKRISPPDDETTPDPVKVDLPVKETV